MKDLLIFVTPDGAAIRMLRKYVFYIHYIFVMMVFDGDRVPI